MHRPDTMLLTFEEFEDLRASLPPKAMRSSVVRLSPMLRIQRIQASRPSLDQRLRQLRSQAPASAS